MLVQLNRCNLMRRRQRLETSTQNNGNGDIKIGDELESVEGIAEKGSQVRTVFAVRTFHLFSRGGSTASPAARRFHVGSRWFVCKHSRLVHPRRRGDIRPAET